MSLFFLLFLGQCCLAQSFSGLVIDDETEDPLIGASIQAFYGSDTVYTTTSQDGFYELGRADELSSIQVSYLGYITQVKVPGNGALKVIRLRVDESNIAANPIIIANPFIDNQVRFNRKEFQVLPGAYDDPSRLLLKAPGFTTANDQANSILYKGLPTSYVGWTVNDAYIVNPNHLSNAGTLSDISSANAGGVSMMSGQVIGTYEFNAAPNALPSFSRIAGNSNIVPTSFNRNYVNLSLIGLEAGAGIGKDTGPNVHLNYRYSTVGLLTGPLGLDFGGEQIQYQDLFARFNLIKSKRTELKGFAGYGWSSNNKGLVEMPEDGIATFKDLQEIDFSSNILLSGLSLESKAVGGTWNAALNYSEKQDDRSSSGEMPVPIASDFNIQQRMVSGTFSYTRGVFTVGTNFFTLYNNESGFKSISKAIRYKWTEDFYISNYNAYLTAKHTLGKLEVEAGLLAGLNYEISGPRIFPHARLNYIISDVWQLGFSYRRNGQVIPFMVSTFVRKDEAIGNHTSLKVRYKKKDFQLYGEIFYHYVDRIYAIENSTFSTFTALPTRFSVLDDLIGTASSYGISAGFALDNIFTDNLNISGSASWFDATYSTGSQSFESPYSFRQSINVLSTYKLPLSKDKEWVFSFALHHRGGLNEIALDVEESRRAYEVVYDFSTDAPRNRLRNYIRMDGRILYNLRKGTHRRFAKSLSLDIQNLASRENDAFTNIDYLTGKTFVQKQLGLIPVLAYRIEF